MAVALIGSLTTSVVAAGGWIFAWKMQHEVKLRERREKKIEEYRSEVRARIEVEKSANEWLAQKTDRSEQSVMLEVRKRTEDRCGLRPKMSLRDLEA